MEKRPYLRDDVQKVIANIWCDETKDLQLLSGFAVMKMIAEGKYTDPQYIGRAWRKVQEECPELRGEKYEERHNKEKEIIDQLNSIEVQEKFSAP